MSREISDCLKRKRDICVNNILPSQLPIIPSQNKAFRRTPALIKMVRDAGERVAPS